jgi:uncharacterized protein YjbI with pentapeptide repeats
MEFKNCKQNDCPKTANTFSDYCGEHLPSEVDYIETLFNKLKNKSEVKDLKLNILEISNKVISGVQFKDIYLQEVIFQECVFINVSIDLSELIAVRFESCKFYNTKIAGGELSECSFYSSNFYKLYINGSNISHAAFEKCSFKFCNIIESSIENTDFYELLDSTDFKISDSSLVQVTFQHGFINNFQLRDDSVSTVLFNSFQLPNSVFNNVSGFDENSLPYLCDLSNQKLVDTDFCNNQKWNNVGDKTAYIDFLNNLISDIFILDKFYDHQSSYEILMIIHHRLNALSGDLIDSATHYFSGVFRYFSSEHNYSELGDLISNIGELKKQLGDKFVIGNLLLESHSSSEKSSKKLSGKGILKIKLVCEDYSLSRLSKILNLVENTYQRLCYLTNDKIPELRLVSINPGSWVVKVLGDLAQLSLYKDTVETSTIKLNQQLTVQSKEETKLIKLEHKARILNLAEKYNLSEQQLIKILDDRSIQENLSEIITQSKSIELSIYNNSGQLEQDKPKVLSKKV